jgi:hypothetical protein
MAQMNAAAMPPESAYSRSRKVRMTRRSVAGTGRRFKRALDAVKDSPQRTRRALRRCARRNSGQTGICMIRKTDHRDTEAQRRKNLRAKRA